MAEDQATTAAAEAQPTTAPETTETKTEAPATSTEVNEASNTATSEAPEADPAAAAEPQATTEANAPDGSTAEAETVTSDAATAATPASAKGKRKSVSGVPEHKKKAAGKRKSMANLIPTAKPGDYFFAKFKGYPPWPSIICDESMLPETLLATRPVSTENSQGELRADFQEGGKNAKDRTYPIMFLETNEFAWIVNSALTPLAPGDCAEEKYGKKITASLKKAYLLAEERHPIEYFKEILQEHQEAEKERQEELAKKEAEKEEKKAAKAEKAAKTTDKKDSTEKKTKRKSTAKSKDTVSDEDEMDVDEKEETAAKPSKKRKKEAESDAESAKPKKTPKISKLKATEKTPNGDSAKKSDKKKKVVSKPTEETEEKEVLTEEQKLERREKAVLYLRHRLQKGFLARNETPKEDEMDAMAEFFTQLESFTDLEPQVIRATKINKVLKGIVKLASIPKEEKYNFKKRSNDMLATWNNALDQSKDDTPTAAAATETPVAKTNGDAAEKKDEEAIEQADDSNDANNDAADGDATMADAVQDDKPVEAAEAGAEQSEEKTEAPAETETSVA
ncbi:hypothetical protein BDV97DRAFT_398204 [Delphinella strobiligena]|nr:hypothetical protein BDV97DRAFT_398204 [Delphinella strobiligena]